MCELMQLAGTTIPTGQQKPNEVEVDQVEKDDAVVSVYGSIGAIQTVGNELKKQRGDNSKVHMRHDYWHNYQMKFLTKLCARWNMQNDLLLIWSILHLFILFDGNIFQLFPDPQKSIR